LNHFRQAVFRMCASDDSMIGCQVYMLRPASASAVVRSCRKRRYGPAYTSVIYSHRDCCLPHTKDAYTRSGALQCTVPCSLPSVARLRYASLRHCSTTDIFVYRAVNQCRSQRVLL
jgi:hypothetical protein